MSDSEVYPGDTLTMQYRWNAQTEVWFENWMVNPGAEGHAAGEVTLASALEIGPWKGLYGTWPVPFLRYGFS